MKVSSYGAGILLLILLPDICYPSPIITFTKVVDESTTLPQGGGTFSGFPPFFGNAPTISNGEVAFYDWNDSPLGIYLWNGHSITLVADSNTAPQGTTSTFTGPCCGVNKDGKVIFSDSVDGIPGLYVYENGQITKLLDVTATVPGETSNFVSVGISYDLTDTGAVFNGFYGDDFNYGIFKINGNLQTVAKFGTTVPSTQDFFSRVEGMTAHGSVAYFYGTHSNGGEGIYSGDGASLKKVIDTSDLIPGTNEQFEGFLPFPIGVDLDGSSSTESVVFSSRDSDFRTSIYRASQNSLTTLFDSNTTVPVAPSTTVSAAEFSASGDRFAFRGFVNGENSFEDVLFVDYGEGIQRLIGTGDMLDGKTVEAAVIGPHAMDGDELVFVAYFSDFSQAIYVARIAVDEATPITQQVPLPLFFYVITAAFVTSLAVIYRRKRRNQNYF